MEIEYVSPNGYVGILYGKSSMTIRTGNGRIVMRTARRNINTYDELRDFVDDFPRWLREMTDQ